MWGSIAAVSVVAMLVGWRRRIATSASRIARSSSSSVVISVDAHNFTRGLISLHIY
jgi:hypothetical protein